MLRIPKKEAVAGAKISVSPCITPLPEVRLPLRVSPLSNWRCCGPCPDSRPPFNHCHKHACACGPPHRCCMRSPMPMHACAPAICVQACMLACHSRSPGLCQLTWLPSEGAQSQMVLVWGQQGEEPAALVRRGVAASEGGVAAPAPSLCPGLRLQLTPALELAAVQQDLASACPRPLPPSCQACSRGLPSATPAAAAAPLPLRIPLVPAMQRREQGQLGS